MGPTRMFSIRTSDGAPSGRTLACGLAFILSLVGTGAQAASEVANAAMRGDRTELRNLIERGADVNAAQPDGATALHWAVYTDDVEAAKLLIAAKADVAARSREGATPLSLASVNGNPEIIERLLAAGADVNSPLPNGETPLMMAARTGRVEALEVLLDRGADVNATETLRGTTALMWAAANENTAAVKLLIEHGADVAARSAKAPAGRRPYLAPTARARIEAFRRGTGQAGTTIPVELDGATRNAGDPSDAPAPAPEVSSIAVQEELLLARERAAAEASIRRAPASADAPPSPQAPVAADDDEGGGGARNTEERGGLTALVFAARQGDLETTRVLLEAGADVNQVTEYGWTALLTATQNRYYQLGKFLLEHGADPRIANKGGWTPLYIATDNRNIEGGDYPTRKPDMDHLEYIGLLLDRGADVNARMKSSTETRTIFTHQWLFEEGATPFLRAAQSGDLVLLKLLLEHGADPAIDTYAGITPLMVASGIGWVEGVTYEWSPAQTLETVKFLLELGANVNAIELEDGRSALMGAAHKGRNDVVQLLVDHGADLAARDVGSRDSIHTLAGTTWQPIDYADGLVRVGVQSAIPHPETAALLRRLMTERGLAVPPEGRTLESICVVAICK
jgi:ankyrin repeat protein